jgi:hypothetical protein
MRITVNLDSDVMEAVRKYAEGRSLSLGKAVGVRAPVRTRTVNGIQVVDAPPDSPRITTRRVKELESEEDADLLRRGRSAGTASP